VRSDRRVEVPPSDGSQLDEFEKEFMDEVILPDADLARSHWEKVQSRFAPAARICQGLDMSSVTPGSPGSLLDMESRWEVCLRAKFAGAWSGRLADFDRFPHLLR
jgi:hypothetical protein